jgi:peroxiredoxin
MYDPEDVAVVLVNAGEPADEASRFLTAAGVTLPCALDVGSEFYDSYDRTGLPEGYAPYPFQVLIDQDGVIRHMATQYDATDMRDRIDALLAEGE